MLYGESSMRNGFGLRLMHKFLSLPFLQLQRETLAALLARNKRDTEVCSLELAEFLVNIDHRSIYLRVFAIVSKCLFLVLPILQSSPDADYNRFLENLVNKRRQIADANPKNLTHFSGNAMSSSGLGGNGGVGGPAGGVATAAGINRSPINSNPPKSIIIGAGQPIIVPGQQMNPTIDARAIANQSKSNANASTQSTILSKVNSDAIASVRSSLQSAPTPQPGPMLMPTVIGDAKVSVEEFCPDGGGLDKGFLDDLPGVSTHANDVRPLDDNGDSDSDSNDNGNPLVAKFHEDPFDDFVAKVHSEQTAATANAQKSEPKINPLAKNKSKSSPMVPDLSVILTPTSKRRSSNSSDDIEIPHILKTKASDASDGQSEFDWLSDSNQRHSPDGGEDEASLPSIDKTVRNSATTLHTLSIGNETKSIERLQLTDDGSADRSGEGDFQVETKEKSKKKKKDKKEKKEKKEKKHGSSSGDKEKKRSSKSKKSTVEDLLSENKEQPSHSDRYDAEDDQYEAL